MTFTFVGDRINATGSRRAGAVLSADGFAGLEELARAQVAAGAGALDVCVTMPGRDGEGQRICAVLERLRTAVGVPLFVDSIDADAQLAALRLLGARAAVNSVNLQHGMAPFAGVLAAAREVGAGVIVQTIDERGPARTAGEKLRVAARAIDLLCGHYQLKPEAILVDPLLFPVQTEAAVETLEGLRRITAEIAGVRTILGLRNGSFGMPARARPLIESVLLHHAVEAGLDAAIADPDRIGPYESLSERERSLAEDLIFGRSPTALRRLLEACDAAAAGGAGEPGAGAQRGSAGSWTILRPRPC